MKKVSIVEDVNGIANVVMATKVGPLALQCPFKNTYVLANTEKVKTADTAPLVAHSQPCNELCPHFDFNKAENKLKLTCTGLDRALEIVKLKTENPLEIVKG